jgi:hypothetical protein
MGTMRLGRSRKMALLRIHRPDQWADRLRKYTIFVDGVPSAEIRRGERVEIPVPPGEHSVVARIDWCSSPELRIACGEDDVHRLEVGCTIAGWRMLLGISYIFFFRSSYLYVRPMVGPTGPPRPIGRKR